MKSLNTLALPHWESSFMKEMALVLQVAGKIKGLVRKIYGTIVLQMLI